jgi:hypothetical protein
MDPQKPKVGNAWVLLNRGIMRLDQMHLRRVVVNQVEVHYSGGQVKLENVFFVNCTFIIDNDNAGRQLAKDLVASASIDFENLG